LIGEQQGFRSFTIPLGTEEREISKFHHIAASSRQRRTGRGEKDTQSQIISPFTGLSAMQFLEYEKNEGLLELTNTIMRKKAAFLDALSCLAVGS
jgi:hypothetical protein